MIGQLGALARQQDRQLALFSHYPSSAILSSANLESVHLETCQIIGSADEIAGAAIEALRSVPTFNARHAAFMIGQETEAVRAGAAHLQSTAIPRG